MPDLRETLWKGADKLRGSMDAAQYKDFVLGLVFLKYVSDSFEERRAQIREDVLNDGVPESRLAQFLDDRDEYTREGVFWVPEGRLVGQPGGTGDERGHRRADQQRDGRRHEDEPVTDRCPAKDLQPRRRRPASLG